VIQCPLFARIRGWSAVEEAELTVQPTQKGSSYHRPPAVPSLVFGGHHFYALTPIPILVQARLYICVIEAGSALPN